MMKSYGILILLRSVLLSSVLLGPASGVWAASLPGDAAGRLADLERRLEHQQQAFEQQRHELEALRHQVEAGRLVP